MCSAGYLKTLLQLEEELFGRQTVKVGLHAARADRLLALYCLLLSGVPAPNTCVPIHAYRCNSAICALQTALPCHFLCSTQ